MSAALLDARGYPSARAVVEALAEKGFAVGLPYSEPPILIIPQGDRLCVSRESAPIHVFRSVVEALEDLGLRVSEAVHLHRDQRVYVR